MRRCLFSISYAGLWGQDRLDLPGFIRHAGELGYDSVMLAGKRPHVSPLDACDAMLEELKAALRQAKVECAVIAAYTDFSPGRASEVPVVDMQVQYVESLARIAARLGAPIVRVFTAYEHGDQPAASLWAGVAKALRECCDRAAAHGVTIAVQNHHDVAVDTTAMLELLADVDRPNCKLGFDAWSPALRGEDLYEAARRAAPHTVLTTNANYIRLARYAYRPDLVNYEARTALVRAVPFDEGFIDYGAFFRGLRDGGFDGVAAYEMCSPLRGGGSMANLDRCATRYLNWMKGDAR